MSRLGEQREKEGADIRKLSRSMKCRNVKRRASEGGKMRFGESLYHYAVLTGDTGDQWGIKVSIMLENPSRLSVGNGRLQFHQWLC